MDVQGFSKPLVKIEQGCTGEGIEFSYYSINPDSRVLTVLYTGMNVMPSRIKPGAIYSPNELKHLFYEGNFPLLLAQKTGEDVMVCYACGVSGNGHRRGYYDEKTLKKQITAPRELSGGKAIYPVTHSMTSIEGIIISLSDTNSSEYRDFLDGTIISPFTTPEDGFYDINGLPRKLAGIECKRLFAWLSRIRGIERLPFPIPGYPLASPEHHDVPHFNRDIVERVNKAWGSSPWIHPGTIDWFMGINIDKEIELAVKERGITRESLVIVTGRDRVFDPELQRLRGKSICAVVESIDAGHNPFIGAQPQVELLCDLITEHREDCIGRYGGWR